MPDGEKEGKVQIEMETELEILIEMNGDKRH